MVLIGRGRKKGKRVGVGRMQAGTWEMGRHPREKLEFSSVPRIEPAGPVEAPPGCGRLLLQGAQQSTLCLVRTAPGGLSCGFP